ncbi:hypothetical protein V8D89_007154 [Ganoderma adspersum]
MSLSAFSRRLSGTIWPRVPSVTTSSGQSSGLRPSYTVSSVDALLRDLLARPNVQEATTISQDALGQRGVPTSAALRKASAYATIGRAPPPRRAFQNDIDENIAETTFRRHPTDGAPLWRPGLPSSLRSSVHVLSAQGTPPLNLSLNASSSQPLSLASPQHAQQPHTGGPSSGSGSLLLGLFDCSALGSQSQAAQGQAQAQAQTAGRAPPAVSLAVLPPLSLQPPLPPPPTAAVPPSSSLSADTTLEPCDSQRIKEGASEETSVHAVAPTSDNNNPMSSAPSVRPYPLQATPSVMKAGIPPSSISMPPSGLPLVSPPSGLATPTHLTPLMALPSPSVFQSALSSPGLAPPSPHPNACKPESPIAHTRRAARTPPMLVCSTQGQHTLAVRLPEGLAPEMVTISAKKGARLAVVADLWHREDDSHYEWEVVFSPADVDMMSVRAVFDADGQLMIHVRRRTPVSGGEGFPPPLVCAR